MTMTDELDDTLEHIIRNLEAEGRDMTWTRAARADILAAPVGESTPVPGALMLPEPTIVVPAPPAMHQGLYDNPEGPFYLPAPARKPKRDRRLTLRGLNRDMRFLRQLIAAIVIMFIVTQTAIVLWVRW